jgi:hypothetical protein
VRPSGHPALGLPRASSPGFGSGGADFGGLPAPTQLRLANPPNSLAHYAKGTLSPRLQPLVMAGGLAPPTVPVEGGPCSLAVLCATGLGELGLGVTTPTFGRRDGLLPRFQGWNTPPPSPSVAGAPVERGGQDLKHPSTGVW